MIRKSVLGGLVALSAMSTVAMAAETGGTGGATGSTKAANAVEFGGSGETKTPEPPVKESEQTANANAKADAGDRLGWNEEVLRREALGLAVSMEHHKTERTHSAHVVGNAEAFLKFLKGDSEA